MYFGLRSLFQPPLPFLGVLGSIPVFFGLPKTIVYDSMAQFQVAVVALGTMWHARSRRSRAFSPWLLLMTIGTAACLLTKQSTGGGVFMGVAFALLLVTQKPVCERVRDVVTFAIATAGVVGLMCLALWPWTDPLGIVRDVFLTGSEPKGGSLRLVRSLAVFGLEIGQQIISVAFVLIIGLGALGERTSAPTEPHRDVPAPTSRWLFLFAVLAALAACLLTPIVPHFERGFTGCSTVARQILWCGLLIGLLCSMHRLTPRVIRRSGEGMDLPALSALFIVLLFSALFHSLSTPRFRWIYDNNPLIVLAFGLVFIAGWKWIAASDYRHGPLQITFSAAMLFFPWAAFCMQLSACADCTQAWPEVAYLQGARLAEKAAGMHQVVAHVRELAPDPATDCVLLLPNDPNVEAWFDRPRPRLSAPIIFADQYWDRLVAGDLQAIREQLPKVIVIGPRNYWPEFHRIWQPHYGASRLIEAVQREIIPRHYGLKESISISHNGKEDTMEIYVRKP
jgi:hypothetical protein